MAWTVLVLNDGETYASVPGCVIATVSDAGYREMENGTKYKDLDKKHILGYTSL